MDYARRPILYLAATGAAFASFMAIRACGESLRAPAHVATEIGRTNPPAAPAGLFHVLLALAVIIVVARAAAMLLGRVNQAPVIGEIVAVTISGAGSNSLAGAIEPEKVAA